jgi:hypothetical protein
LVSESMHLRDAELSAMMNASASYDDDGLGFDEMAMRYTTAGGGGGEDDEDDDEDELEGSGEHGSFVDINRILALVAACVACVTAVDWLASFESDVGMASLSRASFVCVCVCAVSIHDGLPSAFRSPAAAGTGAESVRTDSSFGGSGGSSDAGAAGKEEEMFGAGAGGTGAIPKHALLGCVFLLEEVRFREIAQVR